jgi:hypothetical protein
VRASGLLVRRGVMQDLPLRVDGILNNNNNDSNQPMAIRVFLSVLLGLTSVTKTVNLIRIAKY